MRAIEVGFGLDDEAFIESRINDGVNILFSDENNKGKTLVLQSLMYSIGNMPIFPTGFNYRDATFYSKWTIANCDWLFLRRYNSIIAKSGDITAVFNNLSEFKHFYNTKISPLPTINKDSQKRVVDLELFFQLFFLPQDRRNPANIFSSGYYKKGDFFEMLYSLTGYAPDPLDQQLVDDLKQELETLEEERKDLLKRLTFAKRHPSVSQITNKSSDREAAEVKRRIISAINSRISELQRDRNREENRKSKLEHAIIELNSLNRDLEVGAVKCADCGSSRIVYRNDEFDFDVSNTMVRQEIIRSIRIQIGIKQEVIDEKTRLLSQEQDALQKELKVLPKPIQTILLHAEEIMSSSELDDKIIEIDSRISEIKESLRKSKAISTERKQNSKDSVTRILDAMNDIYREFNPSGLQIFDDLFAKRDQTYSGSEEQEFYFSKISAINSILGHGYPIIIDSFRSGELSSSKEEYMIAYFLGLGKQVILSSTLKNEEYSANRYSKFPEVNALDYSIFQDSHILNRQDAPRFTEIVNSFNVMPK